MKNIIKKNQLMITALAIMIAIAAYLQFAGTGEKKDYLQLEDEIEANADPVSNIDEELLLDYDAYGDIVSLDSDVNVVMEDYLEEGMEVLDTASVPEAGEIPGEAVFTAVGGIQVLSDAKLLKEQTRAKNKETLMQVIDSVELTADQKQEAVNNMVRMTDIAEKEAAAEILLEAKGFSDAIVSMNGAAVDVVVNAIELSEAQRAQIEDIVTRKTQVEPQNIIISTITD